MARTGGGSGTLSEGSLRHRTVAEEGERGQTLPVRYRAQPSVLYSVYCFVSKSFLDMIYLQKRERESHRTDVASFSYQVGSIEVEFDEPKAMGAVLFGNIS